MKLSVTRHDAVTDSVYRTVWSQGEDSSSCFMFLVVTSYRTNSLQPVYHHKVSLFDTPKLLLQLSFSISHSR